MVAISLSFVNTAGTVRLAGVNMVLCVLLLFCNKHQYPIVKKQVVLNSNNCFCLRKYAKSNLLLHEIVSLVVL